MSDRPLAIITGASGGIGEALADEVAAKGYDLILIARSRHKLENVASRVAKTHSIEAEAMELDLAIDGAAAQLKAALERKGVAPDLLINNAGYGLAGEFAALPRAKQLGMVDLNIRALTDITHALVGMMQAKSNAAKADDGVKRGIINVASTASFQPGPLMAVYYASKAYVLSFTEALGEELRADGLHVMALCPGPTWSGFQDRAEFTNQKLLTMLPVMTAVQVARRCMDGFVGGKRVVIPGFFNWLMARSAAFTPRRILLPIVRFAQKGETTAVEE